MPVVRRREVLIINALLHLAHIVLIAFTLIGWAFCETRTAHLFVMLSILASWYGIAPLLGRRDLIGYCPLTDLQWRVRLRIGLARPEGGYIWYLATRFTRREIDRAQLDRVINAIFFVCLATSIAASVSPGPCG